MQNTTLWFEDAMAAAAFLALLAVAPFVLSLERAPAAPEQQKHCPVTVAQYGPGERWSPIASIPKCAGRMVEAPNHILTYPVEQK